MYMYNIIIMFRFEYNLEKDTILKKTRGIGFEEIIDIINENKILEDIKNPSFKRYPNQRIFVLGFKGYAFVVPYVVDKKRKVNFLKTCWPSRKYTKKYFKLIK